MNESVRGEWGLNGTIVIVSAWCPDCQRQVLTAANGWCTWCELRIVDDFTLKVRDVSVRSSSGRDPQPEGRCRSSSRLVAGATLVTSRPARSGSS